MKHTVLLLLLFCVNAFAQKTEAELAAGALKACLANDQDALLAYMPDAKTLDIYLKKLNPPKSISKDVVAEAMESFTARTLKSLAVFNQAIEEFEVDPGSIVTLHTDAVQNDDTFTFGKADNIKTHSVIVTLYLVAGEQKYAFILPGAFEQNGKWYLGIKGVLLHPVETED